MGKYNEIFKLMIMLKTNKIPHQFLNRSTSAREHYQVSYPTNGDDRVISVIQGYFTHGGEEDKLEIMGLLSDEERKQDEVVGWLDSEDVFKRIKNHYESVGV